MQLTVTSALRGSCARVFFFRVVGLGGGAQRWAGLGQQASTTLGRTTGSSRLVLDRLSASSPQAYAHVLPQGRICRAGKDDSSSHVVFVKRKRLRAV